MESGTNRIDLGQYIHAVAALFDHPLQPAHLPLDPSKPDGGSTRRRRMHRAIQYLT
jgi:hypothetical protein